MRPSPSHARQDRPTREAYATRRVTFESEGMTCVGTLYTPATAERPPVVVLAPGFAAHRSFGLPAVAERLAAAGYAAYAFDYRGFGDSQSASQARRLVLPDRQVTDLHAAIDRVGTLDGVDTGRLGLWGTSVSGGYVVSAAAARADVDAVVLQTPLADGRAAALHRGMGYLLRGASAGLRDRLEGLVGRRHEVKVYGDPGEFAVLNTPGAKQGYLDLIPRESPWQNRTRGRVLLALGRYRPIERAGSVRAPTLVVAGTADRLVPLASVVELADALPNASLLTLRMDHFDVYDDRFDEVTRHELAFLDTHL